METVTKQLSDYIDDIPIGWSKIIVDLHHSLSEVDPNYEVDKVRVKAGMLDIRLKDESGPLLNLLIEAESESGFTCDVCGRLGYAIKAGSDWYTRCVDHDPNEELV